MSEMQPLEKTLRGKLERTVREARDIAEVAARASLEQLGVGEANPRKYLSDEEKALRKRLRAHGRQLGDVRDEKTETQEIDRLIEEVAYQHWHRMLFARFLAENNLLMYLVGDKDPRHHEFTVQLRAFDVSKSGAKLSVAGLVALCTSLLKKSVRGGLITVGEIALGGSIEPIHNPIAIAEIAVEKGATALLMPVACRRRLFDLSDDMATKIDIQFYSDARDVLLKAIVE